MSIEITTGVWNPKVHKFSQSFIYELFTDFFLSCGTGFISLLFLFSYPALPFFLCINYCLFTANLKPLSYWCFKQVYLLYQYGLVVQGCNVFCQPFFFQLFSFLFFLLWILGRVSCTDLILSLNWLLCFWVNSFPDFHFTVQDFITESLQACQNSAWTSCEFWLVLLSQ